MIHHAGDRIKIQSQQLSFSQREGHGKRLLDQLRIDFRQAASHISVYPKRTAEAGQVRFLFTLKGVEVPTLASGDILSPAGTPVDYLRLLRPFLKREMRGEC